MHARTRRAVGGMVAAVAVLSPLAAVPAQGQTGEGAEIIVTGLVGNVLEGSIRCSVDTDTAALYGNVRQEVGATPVTGRGGRRISCGPQPTAFRIPLAGDGDLLPGPVSFKVEAGEGLSPIPGWVDPEPATGELTVERVTPLPDSVPPEEEPPIEPVEPELVVTGLRGRTIEGTIRCGLGEGGNVEASLRQDAQPAPVEGRGSAFFDCTTTAAPFSVTIEGNGILVPGPVSFRVELPSAFGGAPVVAAEGELTVERPTMLRQAPPDVGDDMTLWRVAGRSPEGPVVYGSITCTEPTSIRVGGWQRSGRHFVPLAGGTRVECDGRTRFSIPISSDGGELRPGPATVTLSFARRPGDTGRLTRTVLLRGSTKHH